MWPTANRLKTIRAASRPERFALQYRPSRRSVGSGVWRWSCIRRPVVFRRNSGGTCHTPVWFFGGRHVNVFVCIVRLMPCRFQQTNEPTNAVPKQYCDGELALCRIARVARTSTIARTVDSISGGIMTYRARIRKRNELERERSVLENDHTRKSK